jgi:hypothetical protein
VIGFSQDHAEVLALWGSGWTRLYLLREEFATWPISNTHSSGPNW